MTTSVFLNNDRTMPLLGLGLYKATADDEARQLSIRTKRVSDVVLHDAEFRVRIFLSPPRSGITHSVSEMWTGLLSEALTVLVLIISIFI